jgi:hypothetical protein
MIEVTGDDSQPHVFKTKHGTITVTIVEGQLLVSCMRSLAVIPSSGNAAYIHEVRRDLNGCIYEPRPA